MLHTQTEIAIAHARYHSRHLCVIVHFTMVVYHVLKQYLPRSTPKVVRHLLYAIVIFNGCVFDSVVLLCLALPMVIFVVGNPIPAMFSDYWHEMNHVMLSEHCQSKAARYVRWARQVIMALGGITSPLFGLILRLLYRESDAAISHSCVCKPANTQTKAQKVRWFYINGV